MSLSKTGPREVSFTAAAIASQSGSPSRSTRPEKTRSNPRLTNQSSPMNAGGRSSNSGIPWPGTNSARWVSSSVVFGAMRT